LPRLLFSCWLFIAFHSGARADGPSAAETSEPPGYRALVEQGLSEFSVHHYEEARALFARAHALYPNARTHRALGLAAFELRNYIEAVNHFELALSSKLRPLDDDLRKQAEEVLERAYGFIGRVQVTREPKAAELSLDSQAVVLPANGVLLVRIGEHTLEAQAAGFASQKQRFEITGGERTALRIRLLPLSPANVAAAGAPATSPQQADQAPAARRAWYKSPWLWTGVGIVLAGAAAGVGVAVSKDPAPQDPYLGTSNTIVKAP
jgi:tetratricopeptide (TPR) repeat protein